MKSIVQPQEYHVYLTLASCISCDGLRALDAQILFTGPLHCLLPAMVLAAKNPLCALFSWVPLCLWLWEAVQHQEMPGSLHSLSMTNDWLMWVYNSSALLHLGEITSVVQVVYQSSSWDQVEAHFFLNPHHCGASSFALSPPLAHP